KIEGDSVRVFDTIKDLQESVKKDGFRCPSCSQITTDPYKCNSGHVKNGKTCGWKIYGLFGDLGKGVYVFVKDQVKLENIFMPVAWEKINTGFKDANGDILYLGDNVYCNGNLYEIIVNDFNGEYVLDSDLSQEKLENVHQNCIKA
ncbi:hypothetical protein D7X33_38515, partial [Butyricicoccus sp. 1XD8-22]